MTTRALPLKPRAGRASKPLSRCALGIASTATSPAAIRASALVARLPESAVESARSRASAALSAPCPSTAAGAIRALPRERHLLRGEERAAGDSGARRDAKEPGREARVRAWHRPSSKVGGRTRGSFDLTVVRRSFVSRRASGASMAMATGALTARSNTFGRSGLASATDALGVCWRHALAERAEPRRCSTVAAEGDQRHRAVARFGHPRLGG